MKKMLLLALPALLMGSHVQAQTAKENAAKMKNRQELMQVNRKLQNEKVSKQSRKEAKQWKKEGWKVMPGQLSLELQMERSALMQNQFEDDGLTPKYVWGDAASVAQVYDAGKAQALEMARLNLVGNLEAQVTQIIDNNVGNDQTSREQVTSLVNTLKRAKSHMQARLGQTITIVECYRQPKNGKMEVRVVTYYSMDKAREVAREAIREQMRQEGQQLTPELENLLGK